MLSTTLRRMQKACVSSCLPWVHGSLRAGHALTHSGTQEIAGLAQVRVETEQVTSNELHDHVLLSLSSVGSFSAELAKHGICEPCSLIQ